MAKRLNVQASKKVSPFSGILQQHQADSSTPAPSRVGVTVRTRGKSADPGFTKVTAYIRKETHQAVKIKLLQEGQGREFSELVEELLSTWSAAAKKPE